jgi:hypothetical protein
MARTWRHVATLGLGVLGFACWVVMFLAGTDVWHDAGRPDFWNLTGPPYDDLRAFAYAFYLLFVILLVHLVVTAGDLARARNRGTNANGA